MYGTSHGFPGKIPVPNGGPKGAPAAVLRAAVKDRGAAAGPPVAAVRRPRRAMEKWGLERWDIRSGIY